MQYKPCQPRIICEQYLEDESGTLRDFKVWCSKGQPVNIVVDTDRFTNHRAACYDIHWKRLSHLEPAEFAGSTEVIAKPELLPQMLAIARTLSKPFPFVRVDMYLVNNAIYIGELTFTPGSGTIDLSESAEQELGKLVDIYAYNATLGASLLTKRLGLQIRAKQRKSNLPVQH